MKHFRQNTLLLLSFVSIILLSWQQPKEKDLTPDQISTETDRIFDKLIKIRRDFHAHPELAGKESRTQRIIKNYLLALGMEVRTDIYGHSVVGMLKGKNPGRKIAWRADMDALPADFPDHVAFKSTVPGVQHGCGHDVHMAIGLGIATVLAKHKATLNGTVYFIFQPEEETFRGAKEMVDHGLFSAISPDEIYGLHITPLPVGKIIVRPREMFAYQQQVSIKLKNSLSKEESTALAGEICDGLSRAQKNTKPWEIQQIMDPETGLMNPNTIFKDYLIMNRDFNIYQKNDALYLEAHLFETDSSKLQQIVPKVEHIIKEGKYKDNLIAVSLIKGNPTVVNDAKLTEMTVNTLHEVYGDNLISPDFGQAPYFNDDFAYFQQQVPGVYFFLGGSNFGKGIIAMNHAPNFEVDEESIRVGVRSFSTLIASRLSKR